MEKKKKPAIRFKGFTDSWEQRKFDKWGDFYYGHSCPKWSVTEDATIPCIRYGELYTKFGAKIDKVYSYTNMPTEKLRFSKGTEVLIPRVGEDPMDYNHCTWLSLKDVAIGEMISVFNTDQDPLFSATMFNATLQKEFAIRVEGGSVTNLYFDKLRNIDISYPLLAEQKKIAAFFENLDHLITLHQREFKYVYCRFIINKHKYISNNYICIYTKIYGGLKMNNKLELYHGSGQIVEFPEIRKTRYTKDFSWGFYCTKSYEQAYRWAERKHENGIVNVYSYIENSELNIKKFDGMCEEWLDFIAECRAGKTHPYDIVEGPMADDTIWNFVNDYLNKNISKEVFWEYARFKHPSHQISFHSIRALECLKYERSIAVENDTVE